MNQRVVTSEVLQTISEDLFGTTIPGDVAQSVIKDDWSDLRLGLNMSPVSRNFVGRYGGKPLHAELDPADLSVEGVSQVLSELVTEAGASFEAGFSHADYSQVLQHRSYVRLRIDRYTVTLDGLKRYSLKHGYDQQRLQTGTLAKATRVINTLAGLTAPPLEDTETLDFIPYQYIQEQARAADVRLPAAFLRSFDQTLWEQVRTGRPAQQIRKDGRIQGIREAAIDGPHKHPPCRGAVNIRRYALEPATLATLAAGIYPTPHTQSYSNSTRVKELLSDLASSTSTPARDVVSSIEF